MPHSSYDSLIIPKPKAKRRRRVTKKNYYPYYARPIEGIDDLHKMIANPSVQSLQKRLRECYRRLNKMKMAVTKIEHHSPRSTRRRSYRRYARRSPKRSRRRLVHRSPRSPKRSRRRLVHRSPRRLRRSARSYRRTDPVAWARERARKNNRGVERWAGRLGPACVRARAFAGQRPGYAFKAGRLGVGYYRDA